MPRFAETYSGSDTLAALADSRSRATTTPLMKKQAKETLMLLKCIRLIPAAFQGRPPTASPSKLEMAPVHPPYFLKQSEYHVFLLFVGCRTYCFHYLRLSVGVAEE